MLAILFTRELQNQNTSCNRVDPLFADILQDHYGFDLAVIAWNCVLLCSLVVGGLWQLFRTRKETVLFLPTLCLLNSIAILFPESNRLVQMAIFFVCAPMSIELMKVMPQKIDKFKHENHYALKHIHKFVKKEVLLYLMKFGAVQVGFIRGVSLLAELALRGESVRLPLFFVLVNVCSTTPAMVCYNVLRQISRTNGLFGAQVWVFATFVQYNLFDYGSQIFPNVCTGAHSAFTFWMAMDVLKGLNIKRSQQKIRTRLQLSLQAIYRTLLAMQLLLIALVSVYWSSRRSHTPIVMASPVINH